MTVTPSLARIALMAGLAVFVHTESAVGQTILWSNAGGYGSGRDTAGLAPSASRSLAIDASGNLFLAGHRGNGGPSDFLTSKYRTSDGVLLWSRTFNGPGDSADGAVAIVLDAAGNAIVAGVAFNGKNTDFKTIKYAGTDGALMWERTFNGAGDRDDDVVAVAIDSSGNVVVTGTSGTTSGTRDISTIKYAAADGATVWQRSYAGPFNAEDRATAVAVDTAGDVVVTGYSFAGSGATMITLKYAAADGVTSWERTFSGGAGQTARSGALVLDAAGNAIVAGTLHDGTTTRYRTIKYATADGTEMWSREFAGTAGKAFEVSAVAIDVTGDLVVAGAGHNGANIIWEVVKYAAGDGGVLWSRTQDGVGGNNLAYAVAIDPAGDAVVTGTVFNGTSNDFLTIKYAGADGTPLWQKSLDDPSNQHDYARVVALDAAGDAYVAGDYFDAPSADIRILKYASADGAVLWTSAPTTGPLRAILAGELLPGRGMARDAAGNLVVLGTNFDGSSASLRLLKYAAADGAVMWERAFDIGGNSGDQAIAVAVDPSGGIVVAGTSYDGVAGQFRTLKFGADGSGPLWQTGFTSGFGGGSFVTALAVDAAGNAIVTGYSDTPGSSFDFRTIKYAAADGAVLWERSFTSAGSDSDFPRAIVLDAQGNVIVAGQGGAGLYGDYKTIKYAAADGTTLWERSFDGAAGRMDYARAVATDAAGNVIVTGVSDNGTDSDIVTIKYAAADGATLWTRVIAGAAGGSDQPNAIVLDRDGNVLVAGYGASVAFPGRRGYLTFKLAAGDGALLWTASHDGAAGSDHIAYALAVDGAGNAIVTGASHNGVVSELRTIKYRAADGAVVWNHLHNVGAYGVGLAAVTSPGAVVVAGDCVVDGMPQGICTIRFENKSAVTMRLLAPTYTVAGQAVTFDASSSIPADPDAPLTGTFTFRDGATVLCMGTSSTCTVSSLASGAHAITVTFEGNTLVEATASAPFALDVYATLSGIPRLVNIAARLPVLTGNDVLIGGFIIGGAQPKTVVVRARGPSLTAQGVPGALSNPMLQLFSGASQIASNDDWGTAANAATLQASGYAPANALEAALLVTLAPGAYTAIVTGAGGATGVGIVEVFERDLPEAPLVNIAARGLVLTGNDVMIGGFVIQGDAPLTVIVRARGPSLAAQGVPGVLSNPLLQLFAGGVQIAVNDNWGDGPDAAVIQAAGFAPAHVLESAIRVTLAPGAYTAIVTGAGGATGVGIIEVFAR